VCSCHDPRCPMDVKTDVPLLGHDRLAGVDADPDVHGSGRECVLNAVRGEHRVARAGECDEECVALRVHFDPAVPREDLAQCAVVLGEHLRVPLAELIQEACRALDVCEEQSDRAAGKLPHAHMIALGRGISKDPAGSLIDSTPAATRTHWWWSASSTLAVATALPVGDEARLIWLRFRTGARADDDDYPVCDPAQHRDLGSDEPDHGKSPRVRIPATKASRPKSHQMIDRRERQGQSRVRTPQVVGGGCGAHRRLGG
jgi:hypothetical protein